MARKPDIEVLRYLEGIVSKNTQYYQADFQKDVATLTAAARTGKANTAFYWMSRKYGTWCEPEREVFIKDSFAYKIWTYYAGSSESICAVRVAISGMEGDTVLGSVTLLDYPSHIRRVIRSAVPYGGIRLTYADGYVQDVAGSAERWQYGYERHGKITDYRFFPKDEEALSAAIAVEREIQSSSLISRRKAYVR